MKFIDLKIQYHALKTKIGANIRNANDYCTWIFSLFMHPYLTEVEQSEIVETVLEVP